MSSPDLLDSEESFPDSTTAARKRQKLLSSQEGSSDDDSEELHRMAQMITQRINFRKKSRKGRKGIVDSESSEEEDSEESTRSDRNDQEDDQQENEDKNEEDDDNDNCDDIQVDGQSEFKFSELRPGVWPLNTKEWPPQRTQKILVAIAIALVTHDGKLSDKAQKKAISIIFQGRPKDYGRNMTPTHAIRFKHNDHYEQANALFDFYTRSNKDQQAMLEQATKPTKYSKQNKIHLTSAATKDSVVNESQEIKEWWDNILSWHLPKTPETFAKLYCIFYPFKAKNPDSKTIWSVLGKRPNVELGKSKNVPKILKCMSSDVNEVMGKLYDFLVASKDEQENIVNEIAQIQHHVQKANESKLRSKENIENIISEFPHLEASFVDEYIPAGWNDEEAGDNENDGGSTTTEAHNTFVGRASSESARREEVEGGMNKIKSKKYKKPKSGEFSSKKSHLCLSQKQQQRHASMKSNAKYMDSVHIADDPMANRDESMIAIYLNKSNVNKNTGGFRKQSEQQGDKTTIIVMRDSKDHLAHIFETLKKAQEEKIAVQAGRIEEVDMQYNMITIERSGDDIHLMDIVNQQFIQPAQEARSNPARKVKSTGSVQDQHNNTSEALGVVRDENK